MFSGTKKYREENLFFNGVYQVVKVESKFDSGQFLQTLTCVRMNNQQGQGLAPTVIANSVKGYTDEKTKDYLEKLKKIDKANEKWREFDELFGA